MKRDYRMVTVSRDLNDGTLWEMFWVLRPWWQRLYRRGETCRTFWGSHGCDKRRGHWGRHRCGGIVFDRCCRGYEAPPWWAPWRPDRTHYFGDDVQGWS